MSAAICITFCRPVLSAEITGDEKTALTPIKVSYDLDVYETGEIYYIDITWGSFENTYKTNDIKVWDPITLKYEIVSSTSEWICESGANSVNVANHSNIPVTVLLSYQAGADYSSINGEFDKSVLSLLSPEENSSYDSAPSGKATLSLSGTLDADDGERVKIGSVGVKLLGENVGTLQFVKNDVQEECYDIYDYGENLYISYFTATEDYNAGSNTDAYNTLININGIDYYINELHSDRAEGDEVFCFRAGMTVNISEEKADSYKKSMEVYSGKTYIVIINTADMTATMIED